MLMNNFKNLIFLSMLLALNVFLQQANAGTMYRCGNTYQDTKCVSTAASKVVGKTATVGLQSPATQLSTSQSPASQLPASGTTLKIDADCVMQGETAKKIMWMREIGKTADDQLSSVKDALTRQLIPVVYQHRGSSIEVKTQIEQECMQQKEKDRLATQLIIEAQRLRSGGKMPNSATSKPVAATSQ